MELFIAFGAGLISFLSPCVLPLIPGYISYITGNSINELKDKKNINLVPIILFTVGFSIVFIVFGISGTVSVVVSNPILNYLNYDEYIKSSFVKFILNILIIFPIYQIILIFVGTLFGQFNYFWDFQKKFFSKFFKKNVE